MSAQNFPLRFPAPTATFVGAALVATTWVGTTPVATRQPDEVHVVTSVHYAARPASSNVEVQSYARTVPRTAEADRKETAVTRIDAIAALEDGWVGPGTLAPSAEIVQWVRDHLDDIASAPVDASIIPIGDGFVSLVWDTPKREYTAELHTDGVLFFVDHLDSDDIEERELPLDWSVIAAEMNSAI